MTPNTELELKFEIVKHIIGIKLTEAEAAKAAKDKRAMAQRIDGLIAQKQDEALSSKSIDELQKIRNEL